TAQYPSGSWCGTLPWARPGPAPSSPRTERQPMTPSDPVPGLSGADTTLVRRWNRKTVLATLRAHPESTLSVMARLTGLSRQTLAAVLEELSARGLVEAHAPASGGSGRPARRYAFRATAGYSLGLSFSSSRVRVIATDLEGRIA